MATLFERLWREHAIADLGDGRTLVHIDRHLIHEVTSPQAFEALREKGRRCRDPELTFAVSDHIVSTMPGRGDETVPRGREMIKAMRRNAAEFGIAHFDVNDPRQGIVHVIAPELGLVLPGMTAVCGDSHTCTLGALGAWAWGIGTSDVEHVLATQCLVVRKPKTMRIRFEGRLGFGVSAKDLVLHLIGLLGTAGATGYAVECTGPAIDALDMDGRFTLCNMGVEAGARAMLIPPDDVTFSYLAGRTYAPSGAAYEAAVAHWRSLRSNDDASFDRDVTVEADEVEPQITWGTSPEQVARIGDRVPDPSAEADPARRDAMASALAYMGLSPGMEFAEIRVDQVFIGSCTNSRLADLKAAAAVARGRHVAPGLRAMVVPGSQRVKREAESLGLDRIFRDAGFEWREPGCSMCAALNPDRVGPQERCVSTSNRNFEGRQGPRARTHLASPAVAAAAAISGRITDPRRLEG